ncbi:hypothetical protein GCM10028801_06860 [Nocardioides maradonensis]
MTRLVPTDQIEAIVGFRRQPDLHIARADSAAKEVYILHSQKCLDRGIDLRRCEHSQALEHGIELLGGWDNLQDRPVVARVVNGRLRATDVKVFFTPDQIDAMLVRDRDDDR